MPREKLFDRIRLGFLAMTLVWLGWMAQAQLSVVNVLTFTSSLRTGFQWSSFLVDPLVFILWCSVAAGLLFWGRGPFCGWLCPFGALQELANRAAKALKVPQLKIPWRVHERLWPLKYIIFLGLFGVSLGSLAFAEVLAEIEPFKTAIILRFMRDWWFVAFALALLAAGLFVERFFCRYLCPLGAALAIPGAHAHVRLAQALPRMRQSVHALLQGVPGRGHPPRGSHQPERMHLLPALPGAIQPRSQVPGAHPAPAEREKRSAMAPPPISAEPGVDTGGDPDPSRRHCMTCAVAALNRGSDS